MIKKRTELTIETYQITLLRKGKTVSDWCPFCAEQTTMVVPEIAAVISGIATRGIYRFIETGAIHFCEKPDKSLLICLRSLAKIKTHGV